MSGSSNFTEFAVRFVQGVASFALRLRAFKWVRFCGLHNQVQHHALRAGPAQVVTNFAAQNYAPTCSGRCARRYVSFENVRI